jgi:hypothetical protein
MMVSPGGPSLLASFRPGAGCNGSGSQEPRAHKSRVASPATGKGRWYMRAVDNVVAWFKKLFGGRK